MKILLVVCDNDSYIHWFPQGLAYIAAALIKKGYDVSIYNQDMSHYPDEHLKEYLDKNKYDVIGVGTIAGYYQYRKLLRISQAINKSKHRPFFIIGGHGPSPEPEFFLKKTQAEAVVIGEGEVTAVELIEAVAQHKSLTTIKGIAFREAGKVTVNQSRPLIKDIDTISPPAYELFPIEYYRLLRVPHAKNSDFVMPVLSSRGCNFKCNFCYRLVDGLRIRSNASIIEEINFLKNDFGINYIVFSDELLMSSQKRVVGLCEDFLKHKLDIKWSCNGRLNYAKPKILKLMRRAGAVFINYGIEAMEDRVLKNMKKGLTVDKIIEGVRATLNAQISPGLNIVFGNIGDTRKTLTKDLEFLLKYDNLVQMRTIRPVTPYPGSPLYYYAIQRGMLKDCEDFYEHKHINSDLISVNFTNMTDKEFHRSLLGANSKLVTNYFSKNLGDILKQIKKLYLHKDVSFRGFRHI